jgi:hypothetical protein
MEYLKEKYPLEYEYLKQKGEQNKVTFLEWNIGTWLLDENKGLGTTPTRGFIFAKTASMYHSLCLFGDKTQWIGNLDMDEFLILNKHNNLKEYLSEFDSLLSIKFDSKICRLKGIEIEEFSDFYIYDKDRPDRNKIHSNDIFNHKPVQFELEDFLNYDTIIYLGDNQRSAPKYFYRPTGLDNMNDHSCSHNVDPGSEAYQLLGGNPIPLPPVETDALASILHYKYEALWGHSDMIDETYLPGLKSCKGADDSPHPEDSEVDYRYFQKKSIGQKYKDFWESKDTDVLPMNCQVDNRIRRLL